MLILFTKDKNLIITKNTRLYVKENMVDKLTILCPQYYNDIPLVDFTFSLRYTDPANLAHMEILMLKKDVDLETPEMYCSNFDDPNMPRYLQYVLPVDTQLTDIAGVINMQLSGVWFDNENSVQYVLHSSSLAINIETYDDYYSMVDASALNSIDNRIMELNQTIGMLRNVHESMKADIPDDIVFNSQTSRIHLGIDGEEIGNGVEILTGGILDIDNTPDDGVLNLDDDIDDTIDPSDTSSDSVPTIDLGE